MSTTSKIGASAIYGAFDTLNVRPGASAAEIKAAFRKGALHHHPDKTKDAATAGAFQSIVDAHATLEKGGFLEDVQPALPLRHAGATQAAKGERGATRAAQPAPSTANRYSAYDDDPPPRPRSRGSKRPVSARPRSFYEPSSPSPASHRPKPSTRPPPSAFTYTVPTTSPRTRPSSSHGRPPIRSERPFRRETPAYADNIFLSQRPTMAHRHTDRPAYVTELRVPPSRSQHPITREARVYADNTNPSRPRMSHRHTDQPAYVTEVRVPPNHPSRTQSYVQSIPRPEPLASTRRALARSYTDSTAVDRPTLGKTKVYEKGTYYYSTRSGKKKKVTLESWS